MYELIINIRIGSKWSALAFAGCAGNTQLAIFDQMKGGGVSALMAQQLNWRKMRSCWKGLALMKIYFEALDEFKQDYKAELSVFHDVLLNDLRTKKNFKKVLDGNTPAQVEKTVRVKGKIIDMRIVGSSARIWGGAFAGSSFMEVYIKLTDAAAQKTIKEKVIATHNNAFGAEWSGGSSDRSMPADMGQIVGAYLSAVIPAK